MKWCRLIHDSLGGHEPSLRPLPWITQIAAETTLICRSLRHWPPMLTGVNNTLPHIPVASISFRHQWHIELHWQDNIENSQWPEIFRSFGAVDDLHLYSLREPFFPEAMAIGTYLGNR